MASSLEEDHARPSTWQLLFGANKPHLRPQPDDDNNHTEDGELRRRPHHKRSPPRPEHSPSTDISSRLLSALGDRERNAIGTGASGRECCDELLGRHNAFAPQLRVGASSPLDPSTARDAQQRAREIISTRFQVDTRAEAIRRGKTEEQQRRTDHSTLRPRTDTVRTRVDPAQRAGDRLAKLRQIQARRDELEKLAKSSRQRAEKTTATAAAAKTSRPHKLSDRTAEPTAKAKTTRPLVSKSTRPPGPVQEYVEPPRPRQQRAPPERGSNQEDDVQTSNAASAPSSSTTFTSTATAIAAAAKPVARDVRTLDEKLQRLKAENQRVEQLEQKLRAQQHLLLIKKRVWAIWRARVERRRRQEASVARGYEWRMLQRLWGAWRHDVLARKRDRAAQQAQVQLLREKQQSQLADSFRRSRQLPLWFHRWRVAVSASREAAALEAAVRRRRDNAQRLLDRVAQATAPPASHEPPPDTNVTTGSKPPRAAQTKRVKAWTTDDAPAVPCSASASSTATESLSKPTTPPSRLKPALAPPPPDAFYVSMQERAAQRKMQREQLKLKYERQEQEKRDLLAQQVAAREALLEQQKLDEKQRARDKKREEARVAREKDAWRQVAAIKQQSAALHDRLRLLFHYAWRPWQRQWLASQRVARNATKWHALRVAHRVWSAWLCFVEQRRAQRRLRAQQQADSAVLYHRQRLLQSAMGRWGSARRATQQRELAVRRQCEWNETRRAWRRWGHALAMAASAEQQMETRARRQLVRRRQRVLLAAWRAAAAESKRARVWQAEKEQLWTKARMWLND